METADETPYGPVARLAALTGARQAELLSLQWRDVDWQKHTLVVRGTKTQSSLRVVDLGDVAMAVLREHRVREREKRFKLGTGAECGQTKRRASPTLSVSPWTPAVSSAPGRGSFAMPASATCASTISGMRWRPISSKPVYRSRWSASASVTPGLRRRPTSMHTSYPAWDATRPRFGTSHAGLIPFGHKQNQPAHGQQMVK